MMIHDMMHGLDHTTQYTIYIYKMRGDEDIEYTFVTKKKLDDIDSRNDQFIIHGARCAAPTGTSIGIQYE